MVLLQRKFYIFLGSREGPTISRVQILISIETHITCDFPGGGGPDPYPPLDPHMRSWLKICQNSTTLFKKINACLFSDHVTTGALYCACHF